jgi:hypothetical protein
VDAVEAPGFEPAPNHVARKAELPQLPGRDDAVLPRGEFNNIAVPRPPSARFCVYMT